MKKFKTIFRRKIIKPLQKGVAIKLILILLFECGWPTASMALTGGPTQPEVQSFEPIGVSDMVDLFSGDFSYNIPLFDVDGYPMNLSYHSGVGMDQEASWTGLGWNVNPGVINRGMRGLPDDFSGDGVTKEQNVKKNQTVGASGAFAGELFGYDNAQLSARLGIKYNNYTGVGVEKSFNVAISASNKYGGKGSIGLGVTSSSDDGLSLTPSISLGVSTSKSESSNKVGVSIGASFNSRGGLTALTISPDISQAFGRAGRAGSHLSSGLGQMASAKFDFGQQTYSPSLDFPMENLSVTANFKLGLEAWGFAGSVAPGAYYMEQGQIVKSIKSPAYGYMNLHHGQYNPRAMMDYNREKDGSFSKSTYNLPITNLTYDLYTVSGQGTGGSYRPFRSDIGHVFDNESYSTSDGYSGSFELGAGGLFKGGTDISVNSAYSHSGDWSSSMAAENMSYVGGGPNGDYEPWYFKEANERSVSSDPDFLKRYGGFSATRFQLDGETEFDAKTTGKILTTSGEELEIKTSDQRKSRDKRNQTISVLTNDEVYHGMGLFGGTAGTGMKNQYVKTNISVLGHHIGQITSMNTDGRRYVYTLPVYNKEQEEVSFAVGKPVGGGSARTFLAGEVTYVPGQDNSLNNKMGLDNYYSATKMPPFAHSYMLSAVLSSDYVDVTGDGPSDDDLGNYVLFSYLEKTSDYKWRTPTSLNKAKFSQGLLADENDDKGSYVYGVKQLYYLDKITTKNHEATFNLSPRDDGKGVNTKNGGTTSGASQYKLDNIELKTRSGTDIKKIHFKYDYFLCAHADNSVASSLDAVFTDPKGKLTLTELYFTYQNSEKGSYNSYKFSYGTNPSDNPDYDTEKYDRWGNYKSSNAACGSLSTPAGGTGPEAPFDYYPYTNQYPTANQVNEDAGAWHLKQIKLPSGGKINIEYESDDYAFVQDKQATQMYLYDDPALVETATPASIATSFKFYFRIPPVPFGHPIPRIEDFLPANGLVFFKFKMLIDPVKNLYDYVPGYAEVDKTGLGTSTAATQVLMNAGGSGVHYGRIAFNSVNINDNTTSPAVHPIVKAALQFGRINTSRVIWDQPNASASLDQQIVKALLNSSFASTIKQAAQGPNEYLKGKNKAQKADLTCSWIKLKNTTGKKFGGGSRVKKIILNDDFSTMTGEADSEYGQVYTYTTVGPGNTTISSGVASYEPQVGGEENPLKEPFFTETKKLLVPDDEHYVEAPFGESFFPSASVGYSKVKVENYYPDVTPSTMTNRKTGYVTSEFYTAKDFPTITERTELEAIEHKNDPFSLASIFNINTKNHMTASQGFCVELNDMHGKPKATRTYNNRGREISSVEYFYKSEKYGPSGGRRLINKVQTVNQGGGVTNSEVGVFFDAVGDLREQTTETETDGININVDVIQAVIPIAVVVPIPSYAADKTRFRSATITKVIQRFGILEKTIAKQDGSTVTSSDLAYDAESGEVLLTQTINGYNDPVFNFKYPAYWYYNNMGAAYKNLDYAQQVTFSGGSCTLGDGKNLYVEGDELEIQTIPSGTPPTITYSKGWVTKSLKNTIVVQDISGAAAPANGNYIIKVIRSGRRNMQTMEMANITTMVNPLGGVRSNVYQRVVSAKAVEYSNSWNANCECLSGSIAAKNQFIIGTYGNWHAKRSYEYLSSRSQANANNNSNLRFDGFLTNFSPFYKNNGGRWKINPQGWTYASEVTDVSTNGQELENRDALGRYSSATFAFNQTVPVSVAANSKYNEQGYQPFEQDISSCVPDKHFTWQFYNPLWEGINNVDAHTGRRSMFVRFECSTGITGAPGIIRPISTDCTKPAECPGKIEYNPAAQSFDLMDGISPFTIDVEKLKGDGDVTLTPDGAGFKVTPATSSFKCRVTMIDRKGCAYVKVIEHPYTK